MIVLLTSIIQPFAFLGKSKISTITTFLCGILFPYFIADVAIVLNEKLFINSTDIRAAWIFVFVLYIVVICGIIPFRKLSLYKLKKLGVLKQTKTIIC